MVGTLYIDLYTCIFTLSLIKINCLSVLLEVKHYMERKIKETYTVISLFKSNSGYEKVSLII